MVEIILDPQISEALKVLRADEVLQKGLELDPT